MSRKRKYGMTEAQYLTLVASVNGRCCICGETPKPDKLGRTLAVDHDHKSGQVRGLLCRSCNTGLGLFKDSEDLLLAAISYLKATKA